MRPLIFASLLLAAAACKTSSDPENAITFLEKWSKSIQTGSMDSARKYYQPGFVLPKVMFEPPEGVSFQFDMANIKFPIRAMDSMIVEVPFQISHANGTQNSNTLSLTILRSKGGNLFITDMSQELSVGLKETGMALEQQATKQKTGLRNSELQAMVDSLSDKYDRVVYYTEINGKHLFYVVKGNWENPYIYQKERDKGDYQIGVVTSENEVVIPVEFDKIYNPNGSFAGMIEVEKNGKRGLYSIEGRVFLKCEYDGLYPVNDPDVFAQVENDGKFGWTSTAGVVSFNPSSHTNKNLFKSPLTSDAVTGWQFSFPGDITVLEQLSRGDVGSGLIIYPSYLRDLGLTPIANGSVKISSSEYGMGMEQNSIKVEKIETISDKFFALIGVFMESGADAREYHSERSDVFVVDQDGGSLSTLKGLIEDNSGQDPCDGTMSYTSVGPGFYETSNGKGVYTYYKVNEQGEIEALKTVREYNFTKFVKIDESYFDRCNYDNVEYDGEGGPNMVVIRGLSFEELDIMRNEIYAEYGFIFRTEKWKKHFEQKSWYEAKFENVDQQLSETDKYNIKFIREYQQTHKDMEVDRDSIIYGWAG